MAITLLCCRAHGILFRSLQMEEIFRLHPHQGSTTGIKGEQLRKLAADGFAIILKTCWTWHGEFTAHRVGAKC